jgi:aliphatic nitrilase
MSKAFVISACGTVDEDMIRKLEVGAEGEKFLRDPNSCGGSVIVAPNSRILAGPMGPEEGILYAECNLELGVLTKLRHDFAGHYNRPDIFQLQINRSAPHIYTVQGTREHAALDTPAQGQLPRVAPALTDASGAEWRTVEMKHADVESEIRHKK